MTSTAADGAKRTNQIAARDGAKQPLVHCHQMTVLGPKVVIVVKPGHRIGPEETSFRQLPNAVRTRAMIRGWAHSPETASAFGR